MADGRVTVSDAALTRNNQQGPQPARKRDAMGVGLRYEEADAGLAALEKHGELLPQATLD